MSDTYSVEREPVYFSLNLNRTEVERNSDSIDFLCFSDNDHDYLVNESILFMGFQ